MRLSKEDWDKLDELLGRHGWGGYYDLVECLKIVAGDLGITMTGIELYPEHDGGQSMSLPQIVRFLQDWAGLISVNPDFPALVERVAKEAERVRYCKKCGTEMEENPEDSSEDYCPTCNYGYRRGGSR